MGLGKNIFKYRSYTPLPFLILMIIFENANPLSLIIGFFMALAGELIRLWGVAWAGSETRTTGTVGGIYLIISGPFAHARNPLYVGNILMYVGIGVMSFALFPYLQIAALVFFSFQYSLIVGEEEKYLRSTYGKDYEKYSQNVAAFLPRIIPYKADIKQPPFNFYAGLKSEKRTLQAFVMVIFIVLLKWYLITM